MTFAIRVGMAFFVVGGAVALAEVSGTGNHLPNSPTSGPSVALGNGTRAGQQSVPALTFPCQEQIEKQKAQLPKIVLAGEVPRTPEAERSLEKRLGDVVGGKCEVAVEGLYCGDQYQLDYFRASRSLPVDAPVAGFNEPLTHGLALLIRQVTPNLDKAAGEASKRGFALAFSDNEVLVKAWRSLKASRPFEAAEEEKIASFLDALDSESPAQIERRLGNLAADHPWNANAAAFRSIVEKLARAYVPVATSDNYRKVLRVPANLAELVESVLKPGAADQAVGELIGAWRNQFLAANLVALYCKALAAGKDLEVTTDLDNVTGLKALLQAASRGLVPVEEENVMQKFADLGGRLPAPGAKFRKVGEMEREVVDVAAPPVVMGFGFAVDQPVQYQKAMNKISMVKADVRYELLLKELVMFGDQRVPKGTIRISSSFGPLEASPDFEGRKKFFIQEMEKAAKADPELAAQLTQMRVPSSETLKGEPVSGPVK